MKPSFGIYNGIDKFSPQFVSSEEPVKAIYISTHLAHAHPTSQFINPSTNLEKSIIVLSPTLKIY
jgi:hypothetical protein